MLNLLLAVLVPFLVTTAEEQAASNIEVVEIFRAETTEELEAALTDGYPMPWLEEILSDENIPEEDRYWLDCRVRAVIAQDLHLFFDEEGNPVYIEAGYILPGEDYWRECFIINLPGNEPVADPPVGHWAGKGLLVDRYGNEIGEIAISNSDSKLSRDGSVGVTQSGIQDSNFGPGLMNLCFFYPDGSFREFPIHHYTIHETVSQSGELVVASCIDRSRSEEKVHKLYVFDGDANLLYERNLELPPPSGSISPAISPDDRYIAVQTRDPQGWSYPVILFDAETDEELHRWDVTIGNHLNFSPDSRYLCIAGGYAGFVVDCRIGNIIWSKDTGLPHDLISDTEGSVRNLYCTNDAKIIYWLGGGLWSRLNLLSDDNQVIFDVNGYPGISPSGYLSIIQHLSTSNNTLTMEVCILRGGE